MIRAARSRWSKLGDTAKIFILCFLFYLIARFFKG